MKGGWQSRGKSLLIFRPQIEKHFAFPPKFKSWHLFRHPGPHEGRFAIVMIQINVTVHCRQRWRMARRLSNIEVVAIAIMVLSVAMIAFVAFSIWAEP
jgi:hypothetical protein